VFIKEQQGLGGSGLVGICPLSFEIVFSSLFPLLCCCLVGWEGRSVVLNAKREIYLCVVSEQDACV